MTHYCEKHQPGGSAPLLNLYRTPDVIVSHTSPFPVSCVTLPFAVHANASAASHTADPCSFAEGSHSGRNFAIAGDPLHFSCRGNLARGELAFKLSLP
jgi:hypothetical protein